MLSHCFLFLFAYFVKVMSQDMMLGPADIDLKSIEECPDEEILYPDSFIVTKKKYNRTSDVIDAVVDVTSYSEDGIIGFSSTVAKFGDGGYKPNFYNMEREDLCKFLMEFYGDGSRDILKQVGHPTECPLVLGTYHLKDYLLDLSGVPETLLYGDFRVDFSLIQNDGKLDCIRIFVNITPKMSFGK